MLTAPSSTATGATSEASGASSAPSSAAGNASTAGPSGPSAPTGAVQLHVPRSQPTSSKPATGASLSAYSPCSTVAVAVPAPDTGALVPSAEVAVSCHRSANSALTSRPFSSSAVLTSVRVGSGGSEPQSEAVNVSSPETTIAVLTSPSPSVH